MPQSSQDDENGEYYYEGVRGGKQVTRMHPATHLVTYCKRGNINAGSRILNLPAANAYSDTASLIMVLKNFEKVDMKVSMEPVPFKVYPL